MSKDPKRKPFIPRDKPKSWVVLLMAILVAILIGAPILLLGAIFDLAFLHTVGRVIFIGAWATGTGMACYFLYGVMTGKYGDTKERPWSEQVW